MMLQYAGSTENLTEAGRSHLGQGLWAVCDAVILVYFKSKQETSIPAIDLSGAIGRCAQGIDYLFHRGAEVNLEDSRGHEIMKRLQEVSSYSLEILANRNLKWIIESLKVRDTNTWMT
jgi:hypothetical protein